ncbi:MAG: hypothetical protein E7651_08845 [Ruminococcaceae bacterium]|nr:hypothetical protein [Oscillospiraceae bacterium]
MKDRKAKKVSSAIAGKVRVIATAVFISVVLFSVLSFLFYRILRQSYHNDAVNTLYTVSGKCTDLESKRKTGRSGTAHYVLTIDGEQYRLNKRILSEEASKDYPLFEKAVLGSDSVTLRYVIAVNGTPMVADVQLPDGKQFVQFEAVVKENRSGSNVAFVVLLVLYLGGQSVIAVTTYFRLKQLPGVKTALRKAKRKKERAESRGKTDALPKG